MVYFGQEESLALWPTAQPTPGQGFKVGRLQSDLTNTLGSVLTLTWIEQQSLILCTVLGKTYPFTEVYIRKPKE